MNEGKMFCTYSRYYDHLYRDKDYDGQAACINDLLKKHGITNGETLEIAEPVN
jgi:hypothetical protein